MSSNTEIIAATDLFPARGDSKMELLSGSDPSPRPGSTNMTNRGKRLWRHWISEVLAKALTNRSTSGRRFSGIDSLSVIFILFINGVGGAVGEIEDGNGTSEDAGAPGSWDEEAEDG